LRSSAATLERTSSALGTCARRNRSSRGHSKKRYAAPPHSHKLSRGSRKPGGTAHCSSWESAASQPAFEPTRPMSRAPKSCSGPPKRSRSARRAGRSAKVHNAVAASVSPRVPIDTARPPGSQKKSAVETATTSA
jgi:hypothetical protein